MNKDKIIDILRSLGFMPEEIGDGSGYSIEYEGISIIYSVEDDDSGSISFIVPGLVKVEEYNREKIQSAVLHILEQLKYVPLCSANTCGCRTSTTLVSANPTPTPLSI